MIDMLDMIDILLVSGDLPIYFSELWELAETFHNSYERNAKLTSWNTNNSCKVDFERLPAKNLKTMFLTVYDLSQKQIIN